MPAWRLVERSVATDGTIKYALDVAGAVIETVLIPADGRSTVCVSSQSGCTRKCGFCATATLGFRRQLRADEIVLQYVLGFSLLGSDHKVTAWHYIVALAAILTVGVEHGMANAQPPSGNARLAAAATAGTTLLTIIAYAIGQSN